MPDTLLKVEVRYEHDVVLARQRAREIAGLLGFELQDQVRIATAVSELVRNAFQYAGGGSVEFFLTQEEGRYRLHARIVDTGSGIRDLKAVLNGSYVSKTGMGLGIMGARRLMDDCVLESEVGKGTRIECIKCLPPNARAVTKQSLSEIAQALTRRISENPLAEIQRQNQELLSALNEQQQQKSELTQLNRELEETNRGVVALYAELDARAEELGRVSDLKTQFLSNMTHEFRTPLNSILSITQILLDRFDGDLTSEQERQVGFIRNAANDLSVLVNDLLDLAKVEAGKITVRPTLFEVPEIFGMLRGMLKPLLEHNSSIALIFEEPVNLRQLNTDEGKVSQILRNFISNGLKYTEQGSITVSAKMESDSYITFSVTDTGIGIAAADHKRIFEDFTQIEGRLHKKMKGTGLGLPLSRKLAELLGGYVSVESEPGKGSKFSVTLPVFYRGPDDVLLSQEAAQVPSQGTPGCFLLIDDSEADRYILKRLLSPCGVSLVEAHKGSEGLKAAKELNPEIIFLDLVMPEMTGLEILEILKADDKTKEIPVIVHTSKPLTPAERVKLREHAAAIVPKGHLTANAWASMLQTIKRKDYLSPFPLETDYV